MYVEREKLINFENTLTTISFGEDTYEVVPAVGATLRMSTPLILEKIQEQELKVKQEAERNSDELEIGGR